MAKIITMHSFRGGTGKSTVTSNLAFYLASLGNRVLVVDTDIKSPGVHTFFGLGPDSFDVTLNDFLLGHSKLKDIIYLVEKLEKPRRPKDNKSKKKQKGKAQGEILLVPSSMEYGEIANTLISKYNTRVFENFFDELVTESEADYILVDTHPGINEEMLLSAQHSSLLLILIRPDNQDYQGARVSIEIANKLDINTAIILNKVPKKKNGKALIKQVEQVFEKPVMGKMDFSEVIIEGESQFLLVEKKKTHPFSKEIKNIANQIGIRTGV